MSKRFMYQTNLQELEGLMMSEPNFSKRKKEENEKEESEREGRCKDCVSRKKGKCQLPECAYLFERIKLGIIGYEFILNESCKGVQEFHFRKRLKKLQREFEGNMFLSMEHEMKFNYFKQQVIVSNHKPSKRYLAVLYLFTSDDKLWEYVKNEILPKGFRFHKMGLRGISTDGYALYQTAKTIYTGKKSIKINEIGDKDIVGDEAFKAIIHAVLITKYGPNILSVPLQK